MKRAEKGIPRYGHLTDDGRHGPYDPKYVCFNCNLSFKSHQLGVRLEKCPSCGCEMHNAGSFFSAPKKSDKKGWIKVRKLVMEHREWIIKQKEWRKRVYN